MKNRSETENLEDRITPFVADVTNAEWFPNLGGEKLDVVTMIFVLSAIHPEKFAGTFKNLNDVMKPKGKLLFRDYAVNDHAMIRFKPGSKASL